MTMPAGDDEDEWTELVSADFPRVDLVGRPANGAKGFLVMKQDASAGALDPAMIRDLISKTSEEAPVPATYTENGRTVLPNGVHLSGSPAAMAAFIHASSIRKQQDDEGEPEDGDIAKADMSAKAQNDLPDSAFAYIETGGKKDAEGKTTPRSLRHFNISDKAHADNAAARIAQGAEFGDEAKPKVEAAQRKFGEKNVAKEAPVPQAVNKDMMDAAGDSMPLDDGVDGLDPTVPLAMPDDEMDVPGDPTDPGSPAWEAIDAATAAKWLSIAARLKNALGILAEREMLEAASADPSDIENAFDLEDAQCAVDYVISTLAVFAAGEAAEAELGCEMEGMCKALAGFDAAPLGVIEGLTAVAKSGRVLSSANEARIRDAAKALGDVLASLPSAPMAAEPVAKEKEAEMPINTIDMRGRQLAQGAAAETLARPGPVAKTAMSPEEQARNTGPVNAGGTTGMGQPRMTGPDAALPGDGPQAHRPGDAPGRAVVKAALPVVVWDASGGIAGRVSPDRIVEKVAKADSDAPPKTAMQAVFDEDGNLVGIVDPADITPVAGAGGGSGDDGDADGMQAGPAAAAAPAAADMTPQPPADAGTPADAVGKAADENVITVTQDVLKSIAQDAARTALEEQSAAHQEVVAKMAADNGELAGKLETVTKRLETVENTPAVPKVFTNGAVPPAEQLRGQDQGANAPGPINVAKALERKGEMYRAPDAHTQNQIAKSMQGDAIAALQAIHSGRPAPAPLRA